MNRISQLIRLNTRVAGLAVRGRWIGRAEVAKGYNRAAPTYNRLWQQMLRSVTDSLLERLPNRIKGTIIDLGSGTGYVAHHLSKANPDADVVAVDIATEMLAIARKGAPQNLSFTVDDMMHFLTKRQPWSADMIVSTWALGYSHFRSLFKECGRVLTGHGTFGFIVNYADTLQPIFSAFSECMLRFPGRVKSAAWHTFPKNRCALEKALLKAGFEIELFNEGRAKINPPKSDLLPWLRQTGILSGFDEMLSLDGPSACLMEDLVQAQRNNIFHHYAIVVANRQPR